MGISLSKTRRNRRSKEDEYERVLAELDGKIQESEMSLSETRVNERKVSVYFFFYSLLIILCLFLYLFMTSRGSRSPAIDVLLMFGVPVLLYNSKRAIGYYYKRRIASLESTLQTFRAKQKFKIEELKDSTQYYRTRGLIERFDPELRGLVPVNKEVPSALLTLQENVKESSVSVQQPDIAFVIPAEPRKTWMDRLVDAMIGDDSRHSKYALICQRCHAHNGLALPDEILNITFTCANCHFENRPRPREGLVINGEDVYTPTKGTPVTGADATPTVDPDTPQPLRKRPQGKSKLAESTVDP